MLKPTFTRRAENALIALDAASFIFKVLTGLDGIYKQLETYLLGIAEGGGSKIIDNANAIHNHLTSVRGVTKDHGARQVFREVEALRSRISSALVNGVAEPEYIIEFLERLEGFADAYSTYVGHQTGVNAVPLLQAARHLNHSVEDVRGFLRYVRVNSLGVFDLREGEAEFSLVLGHITDISDFAGKIAALQTLYAELCFLLDVSIASHPLRIGNIESGSLWTRLFGGEKIVELMIDLIKGGVGFFHRNYTDEGKISAIPKKIESLDSILNFSNRLKASGVDVAELEGKLAKGASVVIDSLNTLVAHQSTVEVNGEVLSVESNAQQKFLAKSATLRIEHDDSAATTPKLGPPNDGNSDAG